MTPSAGERRPGEIRSVSESPWQLFINRDQAAELLGLSVGGLALAMERGELDGTFLRVGRNVRFSLPAVQLRALGLNDPAALGRFCRELGVKDLPSLLAFLVGSQAAPSSVTVDSGSQNEA